MFLPVPLPPYKGAGWHSKTALEMNTEKTAQKTEHMTQITSEKEKQT